jgi:UDP-N-acetylglucosamine diphosphorylase/glucosamine-1-phosphate N-acetyltransferase
MSAMVLFEDSGFANLLPALYWRSVFEVRCGRSTLGQNIEAVVGRQASGYWTRAWIAGVVQERTRVTLNSPVKSGDVLVNGRWSPDPSATFPDGPAVGMCDGDIAFVVCDELLASQLGPEIFLDPDGETEALDAARKVEVGGSMIRYPWDILAESQKRLGADIGGQISSLEGEIHPSAVLINESGIRVEAGAVVGPCAIIDTTDGAIVIETGAKISPHAYICGPAHIGRESIINPHAHIHGGVAIGPLCKVGGEVDACVFQGYSNKQHDGFLGHSYVGSWVNLGAGTVNSDLKNTYGKIRVPINGELIDTQQGFVGAVIGDHTKTGIGTKIPTGCVVGFGVNASRSPMLPQFIRSFTWMTDFTVEEGDPGRLSQTAERVMARRNVELTDASKALFAKLPQIVAYFEPALQPKKPSSELPPSNHQDPPMVRTQGPT